MASVAGRPNYRQMTVEEFLALDIEGRAELEDGVPYPMMGSSPRHSAIGVNLITVLHPLLRGTRYRPYPCTLAVRTGSTTVRMPDVTVYDRSTRPADNPLLGDPVLVVEILSPETRVLDQNVKFIEYRELDGTDAIMFVDPDSERVRLVERTGPDAWSDRLLPKGEDVQLAALGITLPHAEIFAED